MFTKKGDVQTYTTIFVLLIFFVIMGIGIIFYAKAMNDSVISSAQEIADDRFSLLLNTVISLPELRYSFHGSTGEYLDTTKLTISQDLIAKNKLYYSKYFGKIQQIYVIQLYPGTTDEKCTVKNYPNCGKWIIYDSGKKSNNLDIYSTTVPIYYPQEDKYKIGKLYIQAEN